MSSNKKRKKIRLQTGDIYRSTVSDRGFTITATDAAARTVTVEVERRVISRDGEILVDRRERVVPVELWADFSRSYRTGA